MRIYDIIAKKRDGKELFKEEIKFFVDGFCSVEVKDYQAAALLMAIYIRGMSNIETANLTAAMAQSGDIADLSPIQGIKVDKHSTGGVGDKTTLVLGPLVAAAGIPVAKMSGRGLGHSGGTIDKLESIKGFNTALTGEEFIEGVNKINIAIAGQTGNLSPADKKIYALRDVTATVSCVPLIASSVMSKKIAGGADAIVLDVKVGSGAFMKTEDEAKELARTMVDIGRNVGKTTVAVLSNMDEPLGYAIGNSLEVKETIETLKGKGPKDLEELCLTLGAYMLFLAGKGEDIELLKLRLKSLIDNGAAFEKFKEMVKNQGGDVSMIENMQLLPQAELILPVKSAKHGYVSSIETEKVGTASVMLGAGRETKESEIDYSVGIILEKKVGDFAKEGDIIAWIYANNEIKGEAAVKMMMESYEISDSAPVKKPLIIDIMK